MKHILQYRWTAVYLALIATLIVLADSLELIQK